jgi:hypothetical protein
VTSHAACYIHVQEDEGLRFITVISQKRSFDLTLATIHAQEYTVLNAAQSPKQRILSSFSENVSALGKRWSHVESTPCDTMGLLPIVGFTTPPKAQPS